MCKCTPNIRTPWCGKPGCETPKQIKQETDAAAARIEFPGGYYLQKHGEIWWLYYEDSKGQWRRHQLCDFDDSNAQAFAAAMQPQVAEGSFEDIYIGLQEIVEAYEPLHRDTLTGQRNSVTACVEWLIEEHKKLAASPTSADKCAREFVRGCAYIPSLSDDIIAEQLASHITAHTAKLEVELARLQGVVGELVGALDDSRDYIKRYVGINDHSATTIEQIDSALGVARRDSDG